MSEYSLVKESDTHFVVVKDGVRRYNLTFKSKAWSCDCPARKVCKHIAMLPAEVQVRRYPRHEIEAAYESFSHLLVGYKHSIVGSYRRGSADSKDIDIIVLCSEQAFNELRLQFTHNVPGFALINGGSSKFHGTMNGIPTDIDRIDDPNHYAAHLLYRTGPAALNIKMRQLAKERGFTLNEKIEASLESEIFAMVGMEYIRPEDRR